MRTNSVGSHFGLAYSFQNGFNLFKRIVIMNTPSSPQIILLVVSFAIAGGAQASCRADDPEICDIGPDGNRVCAALERDFPNANIHVYDQEIKSPSNVVVTARVDGRPFSVAYRLENADWTRSPGPCLIGG